MNNRPIDANGSEPNELPSSDQWTPAQLEAYEQVEASLNARIMEVTMSIRNEFPELSEFIEEMPQTVPDQKNPTVTLNNLKSYYESLSEMLNKYREDHRSRTAK